MPGRRGRPPKIKVEEPIEVLTIQQIIAGVMHDFCSIPGCTTKLHYVEASMVIEKLKINKFNIQEQD